MVEKDDDVDPTNSSTSSDDPNQPHMDREKAQVDKKRFFPFWRPSRGKVAEFTLSNLLDRGSSALANFFLHDLLGPLVFFEKRCQRHL